MSSKKRYIKAFVLTVVLYSAFLTGLFFSFKNIVQKKVIQSEKIISLQHISLISQEQTVKKVKELKEVKKVEKRESKTNKDVEKKIIKKSKVPKKIKPKEESEKKEKPTKNLKENMMEAKKTQEVLKKAATQNYEDEFIDKNLQKIVTLIQQNVKYPKRARSLNIQGKVLVSFRILTNGEIKELEAISGHRFLINSTLKAIESAALEFPKVTKDIIIKVPINYILH